MSSGKPLRRGDLLAAALGVKPQPTSTDDELPVVPELPPPNAQVFTTTCQYCKVQCGYKVYVWERGRGQRVDSAQGEGLDPTFMAPAYKDGKPVYVAAVPDDPA